MSHAIRRILIVCEGNHCRSPLAQAVLQNALGAQVEVTSAGLGAMVGHPAHEETQRILMEVGLDISPHRGRQFTPEVALRADLILVMDKPQKEACERLVPSIRGRVFLLGHWLPSAEQEIPDPVRHGPDIHQAACVHINHAIQLWLNRLLPNHNSPSGKRHGESMSAEETTNMKGSGYC